MTMEECRVVGCSRNAQIRRHDRCLEHWKQWNAGTRACWVEDCLIKVLAKGYCRKHYERVEKHGDPNRVDRYRGGARRYRIDETFFDQIDSEVKAYWLGFVTADGCVVRTNKNVLALRVELSDRDEWHLDRMRSDLGSGHPFRYARGCVAVSFDSWRITEALGTLGIHERKSATVQPWKGPPGLMRHYWRGLFDGDGSIYKLGARSDWAIALCGSRPCVEEFASWVSAVCGGRVAAPRHVKGGCWSFATVGLSKPQALATEMYRDATVALTRKWERARQMLAIDGEQRKVEGDVKRGASMREAWQSGKHPRSRKYLEGHMEPLW